MFDTLAPFVCTHHVGHVAMCARMCEGDVDFHFFIWYSWAPGIRNEERAAFAESARLKFADRVISSQASGMIDTPHLDHRSLDMYII